MKKRVLVGMSGGVDSAVTAHLLLEQGYEVVAGFMKNYANEENPDCHTREDRNMALKVSQFLGIKTFVIFDFREQYHELIIKYIYETYKKGLTPNPDILCNTLVKFKLFLDEGIKMGCDYVATGHYARIEESVIARNETKGSDVAISGNQQFKLLKGIDTNKDQSYFLSGLNQEQLSRSLFPIGSLTKPEVRDRAKNIGLPNAERKDSQGLCFIGKVSMKEFLEEALPKQPGDILSHTGEILGQHDGVWFYTIGQRQGLGLAGGPRYVIERNTKTNELIVGPETAPELFRTMLTAKDRHRVSGTPPLFPYDGQAKIRYRQTDQTCTISNVHQGADSLPEKGGAEGGGFIEQDNLLVTFDQDQRAISPGQTIVIYQGDELLGSGIIC